MSTALPLRDIHLPAEPGWWPPAPGWWLLGLLGVLLLGWLLQRIHRLWVATRARRARVALLDAALAELPPASPERVAAAATCLRRVALREHPAAAILRGESWLAFLDRDMPGSPFTQGPGRLLLDGAFRSSVEPDAVAALENAVRERLRRGLR